MNTRRYVLLGLAPARAAWFETLAQWSNSAAIAAEFIKCVSVEEVRARLGSGRRHSALLIDAASPSFDRDLVSAAAEADTPVIVVKGDRTPRYSPSEIGVVAELPAGFTSGALLDVLTSHCQPLGRGDQLPPVLGEPVPAAWLGTMYSVCGPGGTGASTVAIALAQGLSADPRHSRRVLLADLARRADQAMLHDAVDLGPGVQELAEAHRLGAPSPEEIRAMTFEVQKRGYRLLLGLRQPQMWPALRPRSVDAAIEGIRRAFQVVVADITGDFEGESDSGSADVEERNHLARASARRSSVVVAVGTPGMKGVHSLAGLIRSLASAGVDPARILPVMNRAPRNPRSRAESAKALKELLGDGRLRGTAASPLDMVVAAPVPIPERKIEDLLRSGEPLPLPISEVVTRAVLALADRLADIAPASASPRRIEPGSLGTWSESAEPGSL